MGLGQDENEGLASMQQNIQKNHTPFTRRTTDSWAEAHIDLSKVNSAFGLQLSEARAWPQIYVTVSGGGSNIHTHADFRFAQNVTLQTEPWQIPTNLVRGPLVSFFAAQGITTFLSEWPFWKHIGLGQAPNQICIWEQQGMPLLTYAAAPQTNAEAAVEKIGATLMEKWNRTITNHRLGQIERSPNTNGVIWSHAPFMSPFLHAVPEEKSSFVFAGLAKTILTNSTAAPPVVHQLLARTNVFLFEGESTGRRVEDLLYAGQFFR